MAFYVGIKMVAERRIRKVINSEIKPTPETHGALFDFMIGPFKTEAGASYMAGPGYNNPSCLTPCDADRFAANGSFAVHIDIEDELEEKLEDYNDKAIGIRTSKYRRVQSY